MPISDTDEIEGPHMKAVIWHGQRDVRVEDVPDPIIEAPTDAVIRVTTTNICGSDLHLYEPLAPFMGVGNILGHENMGQVVEVGVAGQAAEAVAQGRDGDRLDLVAGPAEPAPLARTAQSCVRQCRAPS